MRMIRWAGLALVGALGLGAATFVGAVAPADAGQKAMPVRMADAEATLTLQGESLAQLQQQVMTLSGLDLGGLAQRMGGLESKIGGFDARLGQMDGRFGGIDAQILKLLEVTKGLQEELIAVRQENAELRGLLGAEAGRLDGRIDGLNAKLDAEVAKLNAKIDAVQASLNARIDATEAKLQKAIADGDAKLQEQLKINVAKLGRVVPVKVTLTVGGVPIVDPAPHPVTIAATRIACASGVASDEVEVYAAGASSTGNLFRWDESAGRWAYNLDTSALKLALGACYRISVLYGGSVAGSFVLRTK